MKNTYWKTLAAGLCAGLLATGCGGGDDTTVQEAVDAEPTAVVEAEV